LPVAKTEELRTLDELIELCKTEIDREGYVIEFEDGYLIKIKTAWYCLRHHLLTDQLNREDYIIQFILDETIDDVVSQLNIESDKERIEWIKEIDIKLKKYISTKTQEVKELIDDYHGSDKDFALKYRKNSNFGIAISVIKGANLYDSIKNYVKKQTNRLEQARKFLQNI
jgi:hypothetical protein